MPTATLPGATIRDVTIGEVTAINIFKKAGGGIAVNVQVELLNDSDGSVNQEFTAQEIALTPGDLGTLRTFVENKIVPATNVKIEQDFGVTFA